MAKKVTPIMVIGIVGAGVLGLAAPVKAAGKTCKVFRSSERLKKNTNFEVRFHNKPCVEITDTTCTLEPNPDPPEDMVYTCTVGTKDKAVEVNVCCNNGGCSTTATLTGTRADDQPHVDSNTFTCTLCISKSREEVVAIGVACETEECICAADNGAGCLFDFDEQCEEPGCVECLSTPAVSEWGSVVMALVVLSAGTAMLRMKRVAT